MTEAAAVAEPAPEAESVEAEPTADSAAPEPAQPPAPVAIPVAEAGWIGASAVACALTSCNGIQNADSKRTFEFPVGDGLVAHDLTLTWSAATPLSEKLRFGLAAGEGERATLTFVDGVSPLKLAGEDFPVGPGESVRIWVWLPSQTPAPAYLAATTDQAFEVSGTLTVLASASTEPGMV